VTLGEIGAVDTQDFVLGDIEADGPLEPNAINSFAGGGGVAIFFPLGRPATWRVVAMNADTQNETRAGRTLSPDVVGALQLSELQDLVNRPTARTIRLRDPVWLTRFHLHHRQIASYRKGNVFFAGDAAHIHSPVGAQGMNTGIQDAWNLGWKLGLVARGLARNRLLDTYDAERWPVGQFLLRHRPVVQHVHACDVRASAGHLVQTRGGTARPSTCF
jgi:2-polyprenyl-6-methoxyphenol hydroxylase-like FAD-dependent oxidoreductase